MGMPRSAAQRHGLNWMGMVEPFAVPSCAFPPVAGIMGEQK